MSDQVQQQPQTQGKQTMNNNQWDFFIKGDVLNFMQKHNVQKISLDDGAGKKGVIKLNAHGEYKVSVTSNDTL